MDRAALIARPGVFEGEIKCSTAPDDVGFVPVDKRAAEFNPVPVAEPNGFGHGIGKFVAAVRVNGMVAAVRGIGDLICSNREGMSGGNREQYHVSVRDHSGLHRFRSVMAFGDVDFRRGEAATGKQWLDGGEVGDVMGHVDRLTNLSGMGEFAVVALAVVDRQCVDRVAACT